MELAYECIYFYSVTVDNNTIFLQPRPLAENNTSTSDHLLNLYKYTCATVPRQVYRPRGPTAQ